MDGEGNDERYHPARAALLAALALIGFACVLLLLTLLLRCSGAGEAPTPEPTGTDSASLLAQLLPLLLMLANLIVQ
jgi:hypothetical protein